MSRIQLRGNCPCCGRLQAVKNGVMSKHGYTVDNGWFNGVCAGNNFAPMQIQREVTDGIIANIRSDVEKLYVIIQELKDGKRFPKYAVEPNRRSPDGVLWENAKEYHKESALHSAIFAQEQRARMGVAFADDLESLLNTKFSTALIEVNLDDERPTQICVGDKKMLPSKMIAVVIYIDGARVYWNATRPDGKTYKSWTGSSAWRRFPAA